MSSEDPIPPRRRTSSLLSGSSPFFYLVAAIVVLGLSIGAWQRAGERAAIRRVVDIDQSLSRVRDQGMTSNTDAGAMAAAARQYAYAMSRVDMSDLPEDVRVAYGTHVRAWESLAALYGEYSGLSGAVKAGYDGDDAVKAKLAGCQKQISDTWTQVQAACLAHGQSVPRTAD